MWCARSKINNKLFVKPLDKYGALIESMIWDFVSLFNCVIEDFLPFIFPEIFYPWIKSFEQTQIENVPKKIIFHF